MLTLNTYQKLQNFFEDVKHLLDKGLIKKFESDDVIHLILADNKFFVEKNYYTTYRRGLIKEIENIGFEKTSTKNAFVIKKMVHKSKMVVPFSEIDTNCLHDFTPLMIRMGIDDNGNVDVSKIINELRTLKDNIEEDIDTLSYYEKHIE